MANFTLRMPDDLLAQADAQAGKRGVSRTEYILELIRQDVGEYAPAVAYWLDVQAMQAAGLVRAGEIEWHELHCAACEQPIDKPMIPVMGNGEHAAVHCSRCGFSE